MSEGTERDDPGIGESVDSFRQAGSAASDGFQKLCGLGRAWFERRHFSVQFVISLVFWFSGNWAYNRIEPTIMSVLRDLLGRVYFEIAVAFPFSIFEERPVFASALVLLALLVTVVIQNRVQTRRLKTIESILTTMSDSTKASTDGGTRELPPTGPRAIGGAIIGAIIGAILAIWFGPGSILAGAFLGFTTGDRWDIRAYERNPLTPDLNAETGAEE